MKHVRLRRKTVLILPCLLYTSGNVPRGEGEALAERRKCLINCMASVAAEAAEAGIVCCFHPNSAKNSLFRTEEDRCV